MQNFGVTNKEHYDMLWYFLEWSILCEQERRCPFSPKMSVLLPYAVCILAHHTCIYFPLIVQSHTTYDS